MNKVQRNFNEYNKVAHEFRIPQVFCDSVTYAFPSANILNKINNINEEDGVISDVFTQEELIEMERRLPLYQKIEELEAQVKKNAKRENNRLKRFCQVTYALMLNCEDITPFLHPTRPNQFNITAIAHMIIDDIPKYDHRKKSIEKEENKRIMYGLGLSALQSEISAGFTLFGYTTFKLKAAHQKKIS